MGGGWCDLLRIVGIVSWVCYPHVISRRGAPPPDFWLLVWHTYEVEGSLCRVHGGVRYSCVDGLRAHQKKK